jgi:hypothetical protein
MFIRKTLPNLTLHAEARLQQAERHLSKRNTKLFHATLFDQSLSTLVSTIANFFTFAKAIVPTASYDNHVENPYILNTLARIAAILVNPKVIQNVQILVTQHPHLLHSIYTMMQNIFAAAADLIRGNDHINAYIQTVEHTGSSTDCIAPGSFNNLVYISEQVLSILEGLESSRANYGNLTSCPLSYNDFHSPATATQEAITNFIKSPQGAAVCSIAPSFRFHSNPTSQNIIRPVQLPLEPSPPHQPPAKSCSTQSPPPVLTIPTDHSTVEPRLPIKFSAQF